MNRIHSMILSCALAIASALPVAAQLVERNADAVLRDAVLSNDGAYLYASAYDLSEVWKIDVATGNVVARAGVGKGASALASDDSILACVNRTSKTVTLIRLSDFTVMAEAAVANGADEISAMPGGGFAVVNSFSDSVTLIDPNQPSSPVVIEGVASVPSGVAASETSLAVTTRSPAALLIYAGGAQTPKSVVPLPEGPSKVAALPGERFAVVVKQGIAIVDANIGRVSTTIDTDARDVVALGGNLYVLGATAVDVYDNELAKVDSTPVQLDARAITVSSSGFVVLSPKAKSWAVASSGETPAPQPAIVAETAPVAAPPQVTEVKVEPPAPMPAEPAPAPVEAPAPEPAEPPAPVEASAPIESAPAPIETPAPAEPIPVEPAQPVVEAASAPVAEQTPEVAPAAPVEAPAEASPEATAPAIEPAEEPKTVVAQADAPVEAAEEPAKSDDKPAKKSSPWPVRKSRIRPNQEVPQPDMTPAPKSRSQRPSMTPFTGEPAAPGLGQTITEGIQSGPREGGFTPPMGADTFLDVQGDDTNFYPDGSVKADGDVRFTLQGAPDVVFAADHVEYDANTGRLYATGDVEIVQGPSTAFADEITTFIFPGNMKLKTPPPLTGAADSDDDLTRKLMSIGSLDAKNIDIIEPGRRLRAEHIVYDFQTQSGVMYGMEGQSGQIRFGGEELTVEGEQVGQGKNLWLTTCDCDHEYYRIRVRDLQLKGGDAVLGKGAQLEIGNSKTPIYWPRWAYQGGETPTVGFDFDSGRKAELGYYLNVGQQFAVTPDFQLGIRLFPTTKEGIGFGFDGSYDFMETPASPLFRSAGEFHTLYTTKDRGYYEWYHRHELTPNTVLLANFEQWGDREFYKDFYYEQYKDRTQPRTFVNVTHTQPGYIATATVRKSTHDFVSETERLPEVTFHLLERELLPRVYLTFDTIDGYNQRQPDGDDAFRSVNVARLSTDIELGDAINITPFIELDASYYSKTRDDEESDARVSTLMGATAQTRFQKAYEGRWGFSGFKHIVVPSLTYSYRGEPTMGVEETPRFDAYDNVYGRSRIESKIDNIVMGRDAETGETWQVARLSLYHGNDLWNEIRQSSDYEIELDLRPRSWWGVQTIGEHHTTREEGDIELDNPYIVQRGLIELYERVLDRPFDPDTADKYNTRYGDYDRVLTFFYYDNRDLGGNLNGRIGFALTKTQDEVFNREVLYGLGYKLNEKWSVAFEHRYDLERGELYRQKYEVRRVMNCLEGALLIGERESGWDFGVEFSVTGIPGTRIRF